MSSAQVIRNLQEHFKPSALFAQWLAAERAFRKEEQRSRRARRKDKRLEVKIGHGGTLDPMATGVLILGVGEGTKQLQKFLECTKTYEATVLFGAATDTYDVLGKVLKKGRFEHLTKEHVENALTQFRGKIMQRPPLYSALRVQGKRLYEYAREGKEVPREIEKRPVEVKELEIVEWMDGGSHPYKWPEEDAEVEAKNLAEKVLHLDEIVVDSAKMPPSSSNEANKKRPLDDWEDHAVSNKRANLGKEDSDSQPLMSGALRDQDVSSPSPKDSKIPEPIVERDLSNKQDPPAQSRSPPAVRLRMTVTSGFYVRSLSHDLGEALGSFACMSQLERTRQESFELGKNVLEYEEMEKGEEVWAPQVKQLIEQWKGG